MKDDEDRDDLDFGSLFQKLKVVDVFNNLNIPN